MWDLESVTDKQKLIKIKYAQAEISWNYKNIWNIRQKSKIIIIEQLDGKKKHRINIKQLQQHC